MLRKIILMALLGTTAIGLSACGDGQPFFEEEDGDGSGDDGGDGGGDGVGGDSDLPPGTDDPTAERGIFRYEADDGEGGGYVRDVSYNAENDTFRVDNLAFDGANVYGRGELVASMGGYAVYEAREVTLDSLTGEEIGQFDYRAIYGVSRNRTGPRGEREPMSQFAIVRTGSYLNYGFGGFVYERNGTVTIPTSGQALYEGRYAGMRVFENRGGLEYTRGDVEIAIDFRDFDEGSGVRGTITNRRAFDIDGEEIALGTAADQLQLPDLFFEVGPNVLTEDGEVTSGLGSTIVGDTGALEPYETGTYYGILGGENATEIVGVFVVESSDPRFDVTAQETGGFIVYRD